MREEEHRQRQVDGGEGAWVCRSSPCSVPSALPGHFSSLPTRAPPHPQEPRARGPRVDAAGPGARHAHGALTAGRLLVLAGWRELCVLGSRASAPALVPAGWRQLRIWKQAPLPPPPPAPLADDQPWQVNIGDGLTRWTDGILKSTYHRVRAPKEGDPTGPRCELRGNWLRHATPCGMVTVSRTAGR